MYKIMFRVALHDTWMNFKRDKTQLMWTILIIVFLVKDIIYFNQDSALVTRGIFELIVMIVTVMLVIHLAGNMPLRLCRGIFICPADDQWKMKYLSAELGLKIGIDFLIFGCIFEIFLKKIFVGSGNMIHIVQILLSFFTFLNWNLKIDIGEGCARKVDENGYQIRSKAEEMIQIYWRCLLILEWLFFGLCVLRPFVMSVKTALAVWVLVFLINTLFAIKYIRPFLREMLSYEDIYCQKPREEVVQYDL